MALCADAKPCKCSEIKKDKSEFDCKLHELDDLQNIEDINRIRYDIAKIFETSLNKQVSDKIVECFNDIIEEQEYMDLDSIKEDIAGDVENSEILSYILDNVDVKQMHKNIIIEKLKIVLVDSSTYHCPYHQRLLSLETYGSNMIFEVNGSELHNLSKYKEIEGMIENYTKENIVYNEMDLISDQQHAKYCHNNKTNITNNKQWMSLFKKATNNVTICDKYMDKLNEFKIYHQCNKEICFIYQRFKNLGEWLSNNADDNNNNINLLRKYLKRNCVYTKYDFKRDQNHSALSHPKWCSENVYECSHKHNNCIIYNQLKDARTNPKDYYFFDVVCGQWISILAATHKMFCHSVDW